MSVPPIGQGYRGVEGRSGYLLRQASRNFHVAMERTIREHDLTPPQYGVLTVLSREPGASGADLARGMSTTPQAVNGVLTGLERRGLIERRPHPTHGRILQVWLTSEGERRIEAARPAVQALEDATEKGFTADEVSAVKAWLVSAAERLEGIAASRDPAS